MPTIIEVHNLTKEFRSGKVKALDGLTVAVERGEIFGIVGPNGAGKTTFMSCLLGMLYPTSGSLLIDGSPPDAMEVHRKLGYLPERLDFIKWMTGKEFMLFNSKLLNIPQKEASDEMARLLRLVELDENAWSRRVKTYSRGMLQRIGMAQALLGKPSIVLLDEPSSGLDPVGVKLFRSIMRDLKSAGTTIVVNSHQLEQLEKICDRVAFIKAGKVQSIESMKTLGMSAGALVLRWPQEMREKLSREDLEKAIETVGAQLQKFEFPEAMVLVKGDEMSSHLIRELSTAGFAPAQAFASEGRLESFFEEQEPVANE
jgi:ABC-2 type transport system ATP-binding protein